MTPIFLREGVRDHNGKARVVETAEPEGCSKVDLLTAPGGADADTRRKADPGTEETPVAQGDQETTG